MRTIRSKLLILCIIFSFLIIIPSCVANIPSYDVIVIGSDPEGISAAVSSARNHSKVLLIDTRSYVGGLYTSGMLSMLDMNYAASNSYEVVNQGFFKEFYDHIAQNGNIDIEETKKYFSQLLQNSQVSTLLNASDITPILEDNKVTGLSYTKNGESFEVKGKVFIDASTDAKFARAAGSPYKVGREELGMNNEYAASTLVFSVKGVDWKKVSNHLNTDDSAYTGANDKVAWGYPEMLNYTPSSDMFQLRRLNMSLQKDGSVVINAFQIFGTDSLDENNIKERYEAAVNELPAVVDFLKTHAVGFENASLYKYADELYIREGVRVIGEYTLTGEDVFNNVDFKNKIAFGSYPMDLQATKKDQQGGTILTSRNIYTLPITIMVPKLIDNLLVVGRSASYDPLSHSSARTVPVGMALGQAAGVLASYSIVQDLSVRETSLNSQHVKNIQALLKAAGVVLNTPLNKIHPEKNSYAYPYMVALRKRAFLSMEYHYKNDYRCKEAANFNTVSRILDLVRANSNLDLPIIIAPNGSDSSLTSKQMLEICSGLLSTDFHSFNDLYEANIIDAITLNHIKDKTKLLNEDVYAILSGLIDYISLSQLS